MKKILITGANQGIGFEAAKQLAGLGHYVYLGSRSQSNGIEAQEKLHEAGFHNVECIELDVTDVKSIQSVKHILESKEHQLDVLINNAGIAGEQPQTMSTGNMANLRNVFETNFFGAVQTTQLLMDLLKKSDAPRIINVSSPLGSLSIQTDSQSPNFRIYDAYSASKTALNAFTVLLSKELQDTNFSVISVEPGYTASNLNGYQGTQTTAQAAGIIVQFATVHDVSTGTFFDRNGNKLAW
ncbi:MULTISPECIES: SDR family NAD(P)-dependent oxidoreductase [Chryseobacterium]|uniref:NAD(P)-dependent dehydrogenase (Short-subunit alcohol dehydrogenase family) n=1 Tax=Chryseobacterium camelliae TaxID=1265445 RepID=A0ABU0TDQ0_9FLAO|nr:MULTISPECIES: SDR family NAD(P)-dependent oxidoreductase [Chryseobacterium]MDT3407011.1 NAD(P)-dependent dehydrogenase (short-subunit alcohol dehydrogenase family) [Pseudacidovorax intermedius]MDQ1095198.1 NAD(P)-dependent dehydrogenase (short-subunit alcohol dehydrogenase family) [Chryseobacterium camelliae]MDQ1099135.1 NAD(P)-dependent dehydrogenase (short-subunit alcohol dehydrogenase family) [Chryseobacterium sp. SORGH_AS_1048]MDR6086484.1 NAD(P)-dependent dehydrogenase (short-subunit al